METSGAAGIPLNQVDRHVGARLRARRIVMQMSEDWLAGRLNISVEHLDDIEAGFARISLEQLLIAADALDVSEDYFYKPFGTKDASSTSWLRDVDHWFASHIFPHERALIAVARKMTGNTETARDVVHDAYADVLSGDKWRGILNPRAYAMKAVRSVAGRLLHRSRIVPIDLLANMDELSKADVSPNAHDVLSAKERQKIILRAIADLPPQCRRVVELRRLHEVAPKEIASQMGISLSMVEKHLAKGMTIIADRLSGPE